MKQNVYTIYVRTGDDPDGGTDGTIFIQLFGTTGQTENIFLPARDIFSFETNGTDKFVLQVPDVGELTRCCLRLESGTGDPVRWQVKDVRIEDDETDRTWSFGFNRWLNSDDPAAATACAAG
ncbi:MAG TPA: PLAT/LH2 domain-containing protein [Aggregatilinea sp.]|jgi:hypothetical protein|uniref:PLAT/LH2 domain-containing protein n=1 Tax=Aggregatilinea sp. TaxID=2806333 RepID=UPI002BAF9B67|nr:PLAT/LH2 domain-containing protein [Aggregatilinea sp.]HML20447.1 PLAT/LH2 domain-containing protein [Aggregatilinea sp.]